MGKLERLDVGDDVGAGCIAVVRFGSDHLAEDKIELFRNLVVELAQRGELSLFLRLDHLDECLAPERHLARDEHIHHDAQGVDVDAAIDMLDIACLLRSHVKGGAGAGAGFGQAEVIIARLGQAHVGDLDHALAGEQDVVGLDVAMDNALFMGVLKGGGGGEDNVQRIAQGEACRVF